MPDRISDFLDLHDNVARRVRRLETGVHPLRSDADWYDSIPPTLFPPDPGSAAGLSPDSTGGGVRHPRYQKRSGIGSLMGRCQATTTSLTGTDGGLYGILPDAMCPTDRNSDLVFATAAPYTLIIIVEPDGQVRVKAPVAGITCEFTFDGVTFPVH